MLETIFKMRIKKWEDSIAVLDANTDNLRSDEQEAISALKNLWRTVAFGPSCTQRVERLVKVLSDADKLHGNNRDIIQGSKDFRGVAKEMYTTDAETLEQFKDAMQRAMGGPRRSSQQQRQHEQQRQQQRSRSGQHRPQVAQPRPRQPQLAQPNPRQPQSVQPKPRQPQSVQPNHRQPQSVQPKPRQPQPKPQWQQPARPAQENGRQIIRPKSPFQHGLERIGGLLRRHGLSIGVGVVLVAVIVTGCFFLFQASTNVTLTDGQKLLGGNWNGEMNGNPATLIVDTVMEDSVRGRFFVKKRSLHRSSVAGHISAAQKGYYLLLTETDRMQAQTGSSQADSLATHYRLLLDQHGRSLSGRVSQAESSVAINLHKEKADSASVSHQRIVLSTLKDDKLSIFFTSLGPCWAIIGLLVISFAICLAGMRLGVRSVREAGLVVVPLCLLAVAAIEIYWYRLMGAGAFWWCDYDSYGFFGTLLRVIPFLIVVAMQLFSIKLYEQLLCWDGPVDSEIHAKPAVICILVSFPTLIVYVLVTQLGFHWKGETAEMVGVGIFLLIILVGIIRTFMLNIQEFGALRGSLISAFILVYVVSCIVAVAALIFVIVRILLVVLAALFALAVLGGTGGRTLYRDKYGNLYRRV